MTKKTETKEMIEAETAAAKEKFENLKSQLVALDEKISSQQEGNPVQKNAQKILAGAEASELAEPQPLRTQRRALEQAITIQAHEIRRIEAKKRIRIRLLKPWGRHVPGSKILAGESKGRDLIKDGIAVEIPAQNKKGEYLENEIKKQGSGKIRLLLNKAWGNFLPGDVVDFGESKGRPLVDAKIGELTDLPLRVQGKGRSDKIIKLKLTKEWGGHEIGEEINIGEAKAIPLIAGGTGTLVA